MENITWPLLFGGSCALWVFCMCYFALLWNTTTYHSDVVTGCLCCNVKFFISVSSNMKLVGIFLNSSVQRWTQSANKHLGQWTFKIWWKAFAIWTKHFTSITVCVSKFYTIKLIQIGDGGAAGSWWFDMEWTVSYIK